MNSPAGYSVEVDRATEAEWFKLLCNFEDATIYQTWPYGAVRWGEMDISHLVLKKGNEAVGLAQAAIKTVPFIGAGIAYISWGPLWRLKNGADNRENLLQLVKALKKEYALRRGLLVRIAPNELVNERDDLISFFKCEGFKWTGSSYRTLALDITDPLETLRKNLDQKWRNQLNRAEKNGLNIIEGTDDNLFQKFTVLYKEMLERKKFYSPVNINEFHGVQKKLDNDVKMNIFVCEASGKAVSAAVASSIGDTGIYLFGATSDAGLKVKGSYLLQWRIIQWLKTCGCRYYDLGGIAPDENPGVYHFKAGLGGKDVRQVGQFEFSSRLASALLVDLGYRLKALGRRLKKSKSRIRENAR